MTSRAYVEGLASLERVATATAGDPSRQFAAVEMMLRELASGIDRGDLATAELADAMQAVFSRTGMVEAHGQDALQAMLAAAFASPLDLSKAKPFGATSTHGNGHTSAKSPASLVIRRASDIAPQPISWLWPGRIAQGKQTIIAGEPGLGKSQLTCWIAAAVTTGGPWPNNEGTAPLGTVLLLSAEDDAADTIVPRLLAAGAELSRVHIITAVKAEEGTGRRGFNLQADLRLLEEEIERLGDVRSVVIDPVSSYLGKMDSHRNSDTRAVLEPISEMAARIRVAVVSVTHLNKGGGGSALSRVIGSIAFVAQARAAFIVCRDPANGERRLMLPCKNNIGPEACGLSFFVGTQVVADGIVAPTVFWDSAPVTMTADEALAPLRAGDKAPARNEAEAYLRSMLADGPMPAQAIREESKAAGFSWSTIRRAKDTLKVTAAKTAMNDGWTWALPEDAHPAPT